MMVSWPSPPSDLTLPSDEEVHVWGTSLKPPAKVLAAYRKRLSVREMARADQFAFDEDRRHFVAARGWMRTLLGMYLERAPSSLIFRTGDHGKPHLPNNELLAFNLSHSGSCALLAITGGSLVGIDVEERRPIDEPTAIAEQFFSVREVRQFRQLDDSELIDGFFNAWTRKEAFVKAIGMGLSFPLESFDVTLAPGSQARLLSLRAEEWSSHPWTLHALHSTDDYSAALAVALSTPVVQCFQYEHQS